MPKEYIDKEALLLDLYKTIIFSGKPDTTSAEIRGANKVISRIKAAPMVDVVEIVRCKDCVHAKELTEQDKKMYSENRVMCTALNPFGNKVPMEKENYCSLGYKNCGAKMDGERKNNTVAKKI